ERRRPDRHPATAEAARDRVLERAMAAGLIDAAEAARGRRQAAPARRRPLPFLAAHAAGQALRDHPGEGRIALTLDRRAQEALERVAGEAARRLGPRLSVAMVLADARTGDMLAQVGSAGFFDEARFG